MNFNEYQKAAISTAIYPRDKYAIIYPSLGLCGESGEVVEKIKKIIRDKNGEFSLDAMNEIAKELGDVLWYIANIAEDMGFSLDEIARMNIAKITKRQIENKLNGNGDNR